VWAVVLGHFFSLQAIADHTQRTDRRAERLATEGNKAISALAFAQKKKVALSWPAQRRLFNRS
jgi:hypothetical protein